MVTLSYGTHPQQTADVYLASGEARPTILWIHGGGWSSGDKGVYASKASRYNRLGWHVVSINYRLATFEDKTTQWPAQFYDVICALEWVRRQAWCVSDRVCVAGDSAGGHLALMLGTTPNPPRLILNMFGPCDVQLMNDLLCKLPVFGGFFPPASACPVYYIGAKFPPTVTVHGEKDAVVSYSQATTLDNTLSVHGVDHKLISYGGGHEFDAVPFWKQWLIELRVMLWLWWRL